MTDISRRSLLKSATVAAASLGVAAAASAMAEEAPAQHVKAKVVYCSPTGNVLNATALLTDVLADEVEFIDQTSFLKRQETIEFSPEDLVVVASPTYGGRIPAAPNYLTNLVGNGANCIVVSCFGNRCCEMGVQDAADILVPQGFNILGGIAIVTDHTTGGFLGRGRPNLEDRAVLAEFAQVIREKLATGNLEPVQIVGHPSEISDMFPPGVIFKSSAVKVYTPEKCINCKTCAVECTAGAIDYDTLEINPDVCVHCQRCTVICPQAARHTDMDRSFEWADPSNHGYWSRKDLDIYL